MKKTKNTCLDENISIIILIIVLLGLVLLAGTINEKIVEGNNNENLGSGSASNFSALVHINKKKNGVKRKNKKK